VALTLISTPGATDANAFVDVDTAAALVLYEPESVSDAWGDLDEDQQIRALVSASSDIDALPWDTLRGDFPTADDQALNWPRGSSGVLPRNLVLATAVLAFERTAAFSDTPTSDDLASLETASTANIQEDTVGPITTKYFAPADDQTALSAFPARVQRLLAGLAKPIASSSLWGSGTVVRAS
jgi:hypothetical protein